MPRDEDACRATALRLERDHPNWIVHFGVYTKQYVAFPRFETPARIRVESYGAGDLSRRMRDIERYFGIPGRPPGEQRSA